MKITWIPILECDDDDGNHTCWAAALRNPNYGRFVWITKTADDEYWVEIDKGEVFTTIMKSKSLSSAKRWITKHMF